jgi:peptidoglycan hydrolase-like protein with peptidoglycan-binding domain
VAGGVLLVILVLAGLAVGGVFSSTPKPTVIPTATQIASTPTTTPATTPAAPTVPAPTTTLKPGDTGAQVRALQRALKSLGYTVGTVDGDYGTGTKTAVQQFQTASNLTADGIFGTATRAALVKALRGA